MKIFVPYLLKEVSYMVKEEVIKLKIEGKSYSEISRILGVNESTAKTIYNRFKIRIVILNHFVLCVQSS